MDNNIKHTQYFRSGHFEDSASVHGKFCGSSLPPRVVSNAHTMVVNFHSDPASSGRGFKANWEAIPIGKYMQQILNRLK